MKTHYKKLPVDTFNADVWHANTPMKAHRAVIMVVDSKSF